MPLPSFDTIPVGSNQSGTSTGLGYHPDLADWRDHLVTPAANQNPNLDRFLQKFAALRKAPGPAALFIRGGGDLPSSVDLQTKKCLSPIENQGRTNACTAYAVIGAVEYLMRTGSLGKYDVSPAFLYRNARRLLGWSGDIGAYIRTTVKALRLFGVPPDRLWPMTPETIDADPDAFTYGFAANFRNISYARIDGYGGSNDPTQSLDTIKRLLADGLPVVLGFPIFDSALSDPKNPVIPFPDPTTDELVGGHAVTVVGYDDGKDTNHGQGALLIRNSWGTSWGNQGYGYLPYTYVTEQLAEDIWLIYNLDWLCLDEFGP